MTNHRKNGDFRAGNTARQKGDRPAEGHLHIRVQMATKGRWVQVARARGISLSDWVVQTLDSACNADAQSPQSHCTPCE